jgi:integrase
MARVGGRDRGLFQRRGQEAWWIRYACALGHDHVERIGPKSLARSIYQQRKVSVKTEGFCLAQARDRRRREREISFRHVAQRYLTWAEEHRPRSMKFRRTGMSFLIPYFGDTPLQDINRDKIDAYLRQRAQSSKPATCNKDRALLSHVFSQAIRWGLVESNPVRGTDRRHEDNEAPRPLSRDEEARLLAVLPERYRPIVVLAIHTGLRLGELRAQRWQDIDLEARTLRVTLPKSGKLETLPLNRVALGLLTALPREADVLFPRMPKSASHTFEYWMGKAGLEDASFHDLRDTYISRLAPHVSVPTLMRLARHRSLAMTLRYLKLEEAHLMEAVEHLVPRDGDKSS